MNKLLIFIFSALFIVLASSQTYASGISNCEPVYGGGEVCQNNIKFTINKMVQSPNKGGNYVENLTVNDPRYTPGANINFKITVKNTGDRDIINLNVVDTFPQLLSYVSGFSNANANGNGNTVNFVIAKLEAGKTAEYIVITKADASKLNQAIVCPVNKVVATSNDGTTAQDESQVCIEKPVITPITEIQAKPMVKNIPSTGPELAYLFGLASTGALGMFLRKKIS